MKLIECPRDAMQGIHTQIPTATKVDYLNQLLKVGFDTLDFGSFVSPKAIPQMADTAEVLAQLNLEDTTTKLLAIIANQRGAESACEHEAIQYLGYPFSISEEFQKRNTNATINESLSRVEAIQNLCIQHNKQLIIYISMAFGNPYGEHWHPDIAAQWSEKLAKELGIQIIALSDTIGVSNQQNITDLFSTLIPEFPNVEFGAHLHTTADSWQEKVEATIHAGCQRIDGAILGYGGCPMATNKLTGNMPTENVVHYLQEQNKLKGFNSQEFKEAVNQATALFNSFS